MNQTPVPAIRVRVDPTNPGQFFACCGLLELADRLWGGAEGHFTDGLFLISTPGSGSSLRDLLSAAKALRLRDVGLGLCARDAAVEDEDAETGVNSLDIASPIQLHLDWWHDKSLKTWAGSMDARRIFAAMCEAIDPDGADPLHHGQVVFDPQATAPDGSPRSRRSPRPKKREPFYFDARRGASGLPIDVGFAPDATKMPTTACPAVEALCMVGLQRCRPCATSVPRVFDYCTWAVPLDIRLAPVAVCGLLPGIGSRAFRFENGFRTTQRKHKAFTPATPVERSWP